MEHLKSLSGSATQFNNQLEGLVTTQIKARKGRLLKDSGMTAAIAPPMKKRAGTSTNYSVPVTRRAPRVE